MRWGKLISALAGFLVLFGLYHGAEYMILYRNSSAGFLAFHACFFIAAYLIARWQFNTGLQAWGFLFNRTMPLQLIAGMTIGVLIYGLHFILSTRLGIITLVRVPAWKTILPLLGLFVFGNLFSSFAEDVLTRTYLFKHLRNKMHPVILIVVSALVYVLNHIYRLGEGMETYTYLFLLGVMLMIPVIRTGSIWITGGIHWAGNCTGYLTNQVFETSENAHAAVSPNYLLALILAVFIIIFSLVPERVFKKFQSERQ